MNKVPNNYWHKMLALTTTYSTDMNIEYSIYFNHTTTSRNYYSYYGLFENKAVRAIGKIYKIVYPTIDVAKGTIICPQAITEDEKRRILNITIAANSSSRAEAIQWDIQKDYRFYLVDEFCLTDYAMSDSRKQFQGSKFFDLKKIINGMHPDISTQEIAAKLNGKIWQ